ncbi:hypothetical protein L9F63_000990 [Diploptera punctata]|uniref:ornithine carbamoyltransferase n=1 Tax=Diploptera punctata TaxID=6984 RepID=A0AAD8ANG3_DIPPU|nr:hypothetical protein L9F63_000990 [Diploptera punctata]
MLRRFYSKWRAFSWKTNSNKEITANTPNKPSSSLIGRDLYEPQQITDAEIETLIWTAFDLKRQFSGKRKKSHLLEGYRITFLSAPTKTYSEIMTSSAVQMLGGDIVIVQKSWEKSPDIPQLGKMISTLCSDMTVVMFANVHENIKYLADGCSSPVLCLCDNMFEITRILADLMTIHEYFGHIEGLRLAYVGPIHAITNTYIAVLPRLGMSINYFCFCAHDQAQSPATLDLGMKLCTKNGTELKECCNLKEVLYKADIIATSQHDDTTNRITLESMNDAAEKWMFLHSLPRSKLEVEDEVFDHPNSRTWVSSNNKVWATMAVILKFLREYEPTMEKPNFAKKNIFVSSNFSKFKSGNIC